MRRTGRAALLSGVAPGVAGGTLVAGAVVTGAAGLLAASEFVHWWGARRALPPVLPASGGAEVIVVLGTPSKDDGNLTELQKWRTQIAVRSRDPRARRSVLVFSGWAGEEGWISEAAAMAGYARFELGVQPADIITEERARTTWENIRYSLPYLEDADVIKVASNSLHAWRARRYLRAMRPDLIPRMAPSASYRFGERWWLKVPLTGYEFWAATIKRLFW